MRLPACRRSPLPFLALLVLACAPPQPCLALDLLQDLSKEKAKELGIQVTVTPRADDVRVQIEYKEAGALKQFKRTDLEVVQAGKTLVHASLMSRQPATGTRYCEFYVDPAALPNAVVTIVVWGDPLTGYGYQLRMKDYLPKTARR